MESTVIKESVRTVGGGSESATYQEPEIAGNEAGEDENKPAEDDGAGEGGQQAPPDKAADDVDDATFIALFEKKTGRKITDVSELKEKAPDATAEQLAKALDAKEKRILDKHLARGGKIEDFVSIKKLKDIDAAELTLSLKKQELRDAGFNDDEIESRLKERYFQYTDEEIAEFPEDEQELVRKRRDQFAPKLKTGAEYKKVAAQAYISGLEAEIEAEELEAKDNAIIFSTVEETAKTFNRKPQFDLGKHNNMPLPDIAFEYSEEAINEAKAVLSDPEKLKSFLYDKDGLPNAKELFELLVIKSDQPRLAKRAAIVAANAEVEKFEKIFPKDRRQVIPGSYGQQNASAGVGKVVPGSARVVQGR